MFLTNSSSSSSFGVVNVLQKQISLALELHVGGGEKPVVAPECKSWEWVTFGATFSWTEVVSTVAGTVANSVRVVVSFSGNDSVRVVVSVFGIDSARVVVSFSGNDWNILSLLLRFGIYKTIYKILQMKSVSYLYQIPTAVHVGRKTIFQWQSTWHCRSACLWNSQWHYRRHLYPHLTTSFCNLLYWVPRTPKMV